MEAGLFNNYNHEAKQMKKDLSRLIEKTPINKIAVTILLSCCLFVSIQSFSQNKTSDKTLIENNNELIIKFIQSKGDKIIVFDSSNIKQFWIDNSVVSNNDSFDILLSNNKKTLNYESVPFRIQLENVNETQDCKIDVILDESGDCSFAILDDDCSKILSTSIPEDSFLHYSIISSTFHMEDTKRLSLNLKFSTKNKQLITIKKIILSFSDNKNSSFLSSPGVLKISGNDVTGGDKKQIHDNINIFSLSGKWFSVFSNKRIILSDKELTNSVTIKNIGNTPTKVYFGYAPYTISQNKIDNRNTPYKNTNKTLTILSSVKNNNSIIVDSYPEWSKGCCLALHAKEDLSDFPNFNYINGTIVEVKKIDENKAEIVFNKPITTNISSGTKARIQSPDGSTYIYTNSKQLAPGEEVLFTSKIKKDDSLYQFSARAFPHGTYYVVPLILSYSVDRNEENTILIKDFTVSY